MLQVAEIRLPLDYTEVTLRRAVAAALRVPEKQLGRCTLVRRALDARKKEAIFFCAAVRVEVADEAAVLVRCHTAGVTAVKPLPPFRLPEVSVPAIRTRPVVVGSGPAGLFAALMLARAGLRPLVLERGRDVDSRQQDVAKFRRFGVLNPNSNVQFGEGGAGTFSDGKLHTGIKDPRCRLVLETFVSAGAPADILWQAKPHIGTDRLVPTVKGLRAMIEKAGGEFRFGHTLTDVVVGNGRLRAIRVTHGERTEEMACDRLILAIGHSARDTVLMLWQRGFCLEQKPFAVGVRIEHRRESIDRAQYGRFAGHPRLGAADYKLSCHLDDGRGVYTFCMCPGGMVVPAASEPGGLAVNGMSEYARDAENSNSALLVGVGPADFPTAHPLAGIAFQRELEQAAFRLGGSNYRAPAQRVEDFLHRRATASFGAVTPSYQPGVTPCDLAECLPSAIAGALRMALPILGRRLSGFDQPDAVLTGVESRSSSPVRIRRDEQGQAAFTGVFPCGEGAGYAGGITSAAVDGIRCAEWVLHSL